MTAPSESCLCGHVLEDTRRFICGRRFTGKLFLNTWLQAMLTFDLLGVVATRQVDRKKGSEEDLEVEYVFWCQLLTTFSLK